MTFKAVLSAPVKRSLQRLGDTGAWKGGYRVFKIRIKGEPTSEKGDQHMVSLLEDAKNK